jgi:hypothetical protein
MTLARLAVIALAAVLALGVIGTAFAQLGAGDDAATTEPIELRKDDAALEIVQEEDDDEGDGDRTRGDDGTRGGNNTGDGDRTRGNDGTRGGNNTGDGDATLGNDGTGGGDNSYVAPAGGGGSHSGGGDT